MKYKEFLKKEYPDNYEAFDMVLSDFYKNLLLESIEEYVTMMLISNGTGKLPEPNKKEYTKVK